MLENPKLQRKLKKKTKFKRWKVSVVIPTYNRTDELKIALNSILDQTVLPIEVLIVDDSTNDNVRQFLLSIQDKFKQKEIILNYIKSSKQSSAIARNIGAINATGDIIIFLDDDVSLDKEYIEKILKVYHTYPYAKCVQGYIQQDNTSFKEKVINYLHKIFLLDHHTRNFCKILPSFSGTYPNELDTIMPCEWISGCNFSCRRNIFLKFLFDENLKRYSLGEDKDLSYRIFKEYPGSLFITPEAKLIHGSNHINEANKMSFSGLLAYMSIIYHYYLFTKNLPKEFPYILSFMWSLLGKITLSFLGIFFPHSYSSKKIYWRMLLSQIKALVLLIKYKAEIEHGNLEFFNNLFNL